MNFLQLFSWNGFLRPDVTTQDQIKMGAILKWFKHFSNADTSEKLNRLIDELGIEGYGRYWLLFEVLSERFDGENTKITLHFSELSRKLRITFSKKLQTFLGKLSDFSLIALNVSGNFYEIDCPMLLELMDKHSKYNRTKRPLLRLENDPKNKKKNKKEEELETPLVPLGKKKIFDQALEKINEERQNVPMTVDLKKWVTPEGTAAEKRITPDEVMNVWNLTMGKEFGHCPGFGGGEHRTHVLESVTYLKTLEDWEGLFLKCRNSKHLTGQNDSGWTVNLLWLVKYDNALKVLSDVYDDTKASRALFSGIKTEGAAS